MAEGPNPTTPGAHNHLNWCRMTTGRVGKSIGFLVPMRRLLRLSDRMWLGSARNRVATSAPYLPRSQGYPVPMLRDRFFISCAMLPALIKESWISELVDCGFMAKETAEAGKQLADFQPGGTPQLT